MAYDTTVASLSDIAPPGWLDNRDPDPMGDFAPSPSDGAPIQIEPAATVDAAAVVDDPLPEPEPEPAPPRPDVEYIGTGGTQTYGLISPIRIGRRAIRFVTVTPPTLWDVQDWLAGRMSTHFELISRMTGIDPVTLGALRWPDVQALIDITTAMLPEFIRQSIEAQGRR